MRRRSTALAVTAAVTLGSAAVVTAFDPGDIESDGVINSDGCPVICLAMRDPGGYTAAHSSGLAPTFNVWRRVRCGAPTTSSATTGVWDRRWMLWHRAAPLVAVAG